MGATPSSCIATEALFATADRFEQVSPRAADVIRNQSYVDDVYESIPPSNLPNENAAMSLAREINEVAKLGNFHFKPWLIGGIGAPPPTPEPQEFGQLMVWQKEHTRGLGIGYKPIEDVIKFSMTLNFSKKKST